MKGKVKACINPIPFFAFTTDCWTSQAVDSFLSLTAHYTDENFKRQLLVLDTISVSVRHTAQNLLSRIWRFRKHGKSNERGLPALWETNASNSTAATREWEFHHIGCVDHTLQHYSNQWQSQSCMMLYQISWHQLEQLQDTSTIPHLLDTCLTVFTVSCNCPNTNRWKTALPDGIPRAIRLLRQHVIKPPGGENEDIRKELEKSLTERFRGMETCMGTPQYGYTTWP